MIVRVDPWAEEYALEASERMYVAICCPLDRCPILNSAGQSTTVVSSRESTGLLYVAGREGESMEGRSPAELLKQELGRSKQFQESWIEWNDDEASIIQGADFGIVPMKGSGPDKWDSVIEPIADLLVVAGNKLDAASDRVERVWSLLRGLAEYAGMLVEIHPAAQAELEDRVSKRDELKTWLRGTLTTVLELEKKCARFSRKTTKR